MNMKNLLFASVAFATLSVLATENVTVTGTRQRWPWNGIVDIDFALEGKATQLYRVEVSATSAGGKTRYRAATFLQEPVCQTGENRLSWNVGADFPGVRADDFAVTVEAYPADMVDVYCVIDVSAGPEATKYPVRYTFRPPEHVRGATSEPCQLTEIWLKRIKRGVLPFGAVDSNREGDFKVKFSKDYYIGIFEITQRQWYQVMGTWPSQFSNPLYRDARPVEMVTHDEILGHHNWPDNKTVAADSFVGRIRARTGLTTFNLPTDAQYEFAARAGLNKTSIRPVAAKTNADFANVQRSSCSKEVAAEADTTKGTLPVGSLVPNDWGLYDVCGNVGERVLDSYVATSGSTSGNDLVHLYADEIAQNGYVLDPEGPPNSTSAPVHPQTVWRHSVRGGYYDNTDTAWLWPYKRRDDHNPGNDLGLRCAITCE